LYDVKHVDTSV